MKNRTLSLTLVALFALAFATACATTAVQQPTPAVATAKAAHAMFGDLRNEEDRSERRDRGCRSNGDAVENDAEDCEVVNDE
ncbi:MAG: hypothetical protein Q7S02_00185 [bacterium]|nr:hypothetical protein [bacterium]